MLFCFCHKKKSNKLSKHPVSLQLATVLAKQYKTLCKSHKLLASQSLLLCMLLLFWRLEVIFIPAFEQSWSSSISNVVFPSRLIMQRTLKRKKCVHCAAATSDPWPRFKPIKQDNGRFMKSRGARTALPLSLFVAPTCEWTLRSLQTAPGFLRRLCLAKTETNWCCWGQSAANDSLSLVLMNLCSAWSGVQDKDPSALAH